MSDDLYSIHLGDAFEEITRIPSGSVDLILTDPPYNIANYSTGNISFNGRRKDFNNDIADWDRDVVDPVAMADEMRRILAPTGNIFIFTGSNYFGRWHAALDPIFDTFQYMAWHKTNPPPSVRKSSFLNSLELIVCCWNRGHTWNFLSQREMHNFIQSPLCGGNERFAHPTQKPLRVLEHIIVRASNQEQTVFDPFMGVGSTGVAAVRLGRRFRGCEIHPPYFEIAQRRLTQERHLHGVFDVKVQAALSDHLPHREGPEGDEHVEEGLDG